MTLYLNTVMNTNIEFVACYNVIDGTVLRTFTYFSPEGIVHVPNFAA